MADMMSLIKELREKTGAGMLDCKKALSESNMDLVAAEAWLKEKGVLKAAKKADRVAAEGLALTYFSADQTLGLILEINCETDFVSRGEPFRKLMNDTAAILLNNQPATLDEAIGLTQTLFTDATVKIGEKLSLRRFTFMNKLANQHFGQYIHMQGAVASLVVLEGGDATFAEQLAMHITDRSPEYISLDQVPSAIIQAEKVLQQSKVADDPKLASKPANIIEKIIEGKVMTFFKEKSLDIQPYMFDEAGQPVKQFLQQHKATVKSFTRYKVGEGIEKKEVDFAAEVLTQVKNTQ
jgi:elongation factor Ts